MAKWIASCLDINGQRMEVEVDPNTHVATFPSSPASGVLFERIEDDPAPIYQKAIEANDNFAAQLAAWRQERG